MKKLWIALGVLAILTPIGMLAPGTAWGEWGLEELREMGVSVPGGLEKLADINPLAFLPDYSMPWISGGFPVQAAVYISSAIVGTGLCVGLIYLLTLGRK